MRIPFPTTVIAAVALSAAPAAAVTYVGTRQIGAGSVDLTIATDGRTGVLAAADITAWTVVMRDPTSASPVRTLTSDGVAGSLRGVVFASGTAVSATPTALSFAFGPGNLLFDTEATGRPFYQLVSSGCDTGYSGETRACEQFDTGSDFGSQHVQYILHSAGDTVVLATAAAVPEPAAWALMTLGFGLIGGVARSRTVQAS